MDQYGKAVRVGSMVLAVALVLRLGTMGFFAPVAGLLTSQTAAAVFLFLETGHILRPVTYVAPTVPENTESPAPTDPVEPTQPDITPTEPDKPSQAVTVFGPADASLVKIHSDCGYVADVPALLLQPLTWELKQSQPTVLIIHSHATESYADMEQDGYRSQDVQDNMVFMGDVLVRLLEARGIQALHDRQLHDYPSYSDAYTNSRESIKAYLEQHPSIRLVLDLHRDSITNDRGVQVRDTVQTPSGDAARLMLVVGTDASGLSHAKWPENMSLAVKFHAQLEKICPGICRPINFRSHRYNQDLSTGALLVEVGSAGNTRQESLLALEYLAQTIIDLSAGTK